MGARSRLGAIPILLAAGLLACGGGATPGTAVEQQAASGAKGPRVIRVPQDQPTIAAAMAAAAPGDTVKLAPGTYRETLALRTGVKVVGGPSTIDATGLDHGITADPPVKDATVTNLIIQGSTGSGIVVTGAEVRLRQVTARAAGFSGLLTLDGARVRLSNCDFSGNGTRGLNVNFSEVEVEDSRVLDNGAAGIGMAASAVTVSGSLLRGNGGAGNVRVSYGSTARLEQNQIVGGGNGVFLDAGDDPADPRPATATLEANQISSAAGHGIAILDGSTAKASHCSVQGNGGDGVHVEHGSSARLEQNRIVGNGAGVVVHGGSDPVDQRRSSAHLEGNVSTGGAVGLQVINSDVVSDGDDFDGNVSFGILAAFGADVRASGGSISGNGSHGLWSMDVPFGFFCADPDCTAFLTPQATVHVALDGMQAAENGGIGVVAQPGGAVSIRRSAILRNRDNGLFGNSGAEGIHGSMLVRQTRIEGNAGWCAIASGDSALDLGSGAGGFNTCVGNGNAGGVANTTTSQSPIPAEGNWWGTTDAAAIAAMMFGPVDFVPFLAAAP